MSARFGRLRQGQVTPSRLYLLTLTFADLPAMPLADFDGEPEVDRWARCEALSAAWASFTYRLTRGAIRSGPDGFREVGASAKKGDRRRRLIPRSWSSDGGAEWVDYAPGHPLRLRSVGTGASRLVHYVGGFEVGEREGRPHAHMVVSLPAGMSPAVFWSAWPHGEVRVDVVKNDVRAIAYAVGYSAKAGLRIGRVRTSGRLPRYLIGAVSGASPKDVLAVQAEGRSALMRVARLRDAACRKADVFAPVVFRYPLQEDAPPEDDGVMPLSWEPWERGRFGEG